MRLLLALDVLAFVICMLAFVFTGKPPYLIAAAFLSAAVALYPGR